MNEQRKGRKRDICKTTDIDHLNSELETNLAHRVY